MTTATKPLRICITKRKDGGAVLKCVRADGSETWQRQEGVHAAFFPLHDLTHFSVESVLGIRDGFFGLIATGWSIDETTGKTPRGPIGPDALFVENVVGTLDVERASHSRWTAVEFNENCARHARNGGRPEPRLLTDAELDRVRDRMAELFAMWAALPPGDTLDLKF